MVVVVRMRQWVDVTIYAGRLKGIRVIATIDRATIPHSGPRVERERVRERSSPTGELGVGYISLHKIPG